MKFFVKMKDCSNKINLLWAHFLFMRPFTRLYQFIQSFYRNSCFVYSFILNNKSYSAFVNNDDKHTKNQQSNKTTKIKNNYSFNYFIFHSEYIFRSKHMTGILLSKKFKNTIILKLHFFINPRIFCKTFHDNIKTDFNFEVLKT